MRELGSPLDSTAELLELTRQDALGPLLRDVDVEGEATVDATEL